MKPVSLIAVLACTLFAGSAQQAVSSNTPIAIASGEVMGGIRPGENLNNKTPKRRDRQADHSLCNQFASHISSLHSPTRYGFFVISQTSKPFYANSICKLSAACFHNNNKSAVWPEDCFTSVDLNDRSEDMKMTLNQASIGRNVLSYFIRGLLVSKRNSGVKTRNCLSGSDTDWPWGFRHVSVIT